MATIQRELAEKLIAGQGKYEEDKEAYCVVRYQNRTKYGIPRVSLYNHDAKINCFDYAVCYSERAYQALMNSETVGGIDILWGSAQFKKDEKKRVETEEIGEMGFLWIDLVGESKEHQSKSRRKGKER